MLHDLLVFLFTSPAPDHCPPRGARLGPADKEKYPYGTSAQRGRGRYTRKAEPFPSRGKEGVFLDSPDPESTHVLERRLRVHGGSGLWACDFLPPAKALHFHFAVGPMHYAAGPAKIQTQEMELLITVQISPSSIREGQHLFLIPSAVQLALIAASLPAPLYGKRGTCGTGNQRALPGFALCSSHRMRDFPFSCSNRCPHVSSEGSIDHYFKTTNKDKVSPRG